jgi:16S rRNA (cytosine967-C5)-methyltransferase
MNEQKMSMSKLEAQARACRDALQEVMEAVFVHKRPADRTLNSFLRNNKQYGSRDRKLLSEAVFAVFRWWGAIRKLFDREELEVLESEVPEISYNGAAALLLTAMVMEKRELPEVAVIWMRELGLRQSEVNDLVVTGKGSDGLDGWRILGLVRAALRRKALKSLKLTPFDLVPEWFPKYLPADIKAEKLALWFQRRPPMWLRVQNNADPVRLAADLKEKYLLNVKSNPAFPNALSIARPQVNLYGIEEYRKGMFEVQDLASQMIGLVCAPKPGQRWWDACAGAGGKTLQLADQMKQKGTVVATDIRAYKLDDLRTRAKRAGFPNIECREWNGKSLRSKQQKVYDGVLVDAPCSCSGTWRRNPDARWSTDEAEIAEISKLQLEILSHASGGVKPDGILVYATCSICEPENTAVVEAFLAADPEFELEKFINPLTGGECSGMLHIYPWDGDCDAMFAARMRRKKAE